MISTRIITLASLALAAAMAQTPPPPAAPAPPAPKAATAPTPVAPPAPPAAPGMHQLLPAAPPIDPGDIAVQVQNAMGDIDFKALTDVADKFKDMKIDLKDMKFDFNLDLDLDLAREQADLAREQADLIRDQARDAAEQAREMAREAAEQARDNFDWSGFAKGFAFQTPAPAPMPPLPPKAMVNLNWNRHSGTDSLYERGLSALDTRRYDQALDAFTEVATRGQTHADGALYWKAYTLNKLGRRDEAVAALNTLRTSFASSHWLDDAKALEIEIKQSSGQKVSPESESNDELKLLALDGLIQSDPDRAFPILEKLLKGPQSPNLKKRAIYVLALNNAPRAQQLLEQIARGGGNPDLQMTAIQYLGRSGKNANKTQVLFDIYNNSADANVKRAVLRSLASDRDKDHLVQIAKAEKTPELRLEAIRMVGSTASSPELWALYQSETDPDAKRALLDYMSGSTDRLLEVARTEKDPNLRRSAVQRLGSDKSASAGDALAQIYASDQDQNVKRAIIDTLAGSHNVTALIKIGRNEQNVDMKKAIVRRLVDMRSPEANQFLEEILK